MPLLLASPCFLLLVFLDRLRFQALYLEPDGAFFVSEGRSRCLFLEQDPFIGLLLGGELTAAMLCRSDQLHHYFTDLVPFLRDPAFLSFEVSEGIFRDSRILAAELFFEPRGRLLGRRR